MKYIEKRIFQRTLEMTDKESKEYEKYAKEGVYVHTDMRNDKDDKHVKFIRIYLYKKEKL